MRALLLQERDPTTISYHEDHINKFPDYDKGKESLFNSQREGSTPNFHVLMTYYAITFPICQPVKHGHASLGWYDNMPKRSRQATSESSRKGVSVSMNMDMDSKMDHAHVAHSLGSGSQRSIKNTAYIELKPIERWRPVSSKLRPSLLSSASEYESDHEELGSVSSQFILRSAHLHEFSGWWLLQWKKKQEW